MKNTINVPLVRIFGVIAFAAIIGCSMIACDNGSGGGNGGNQHVETFLSAGTYTFNPRIRATEGGVPQDSYLVKAVVAGNKVTFYISAVPTDAAAWSEYNWGLGTQNIVLKEKNTLSSYSVKNYGWDGQNTSFDFLEFHDVKGSLFTLSHNRDNFKYVFDNIDLSAPDVP